MDISYEEAVSQLNLGKVERRLHSSQPNAACLVIKNDDGRLSVIKFRSAEQVNQNVHLSSWVTETHTRRTRRGDAADAADDHFDPLAALLEEFSRQDEAARKGAGQYVVPVERTGYLSDTAYCVRDWHEFSLQQLIEGKVRPHSSNDLFHLVHNVWTALCFLHQPRLNVPHGNLKPANVLLDQGEGDTWSHLLTDMQMRSETDYITAKREDMQGLGMLIAQYCESRPEFGDWMAADACVSRARWDFLGEHEMEWKKLCRQLLTPEHYPEDYDTEVDRHTLLRPLRPEGYKLAVVPPPAQVGNTVRSTLVAERLRQVRKQIDAGEWLAAIEELCRLEEQCQEGENSRQRPEVLSILNLAVDTVPSIESSPHALTILQRAAKCNCALASYRLGDYYRRTEPNQARRFLAQAAELGMVRGFILLGEMYLNGAPGLQPDVSAAATNFEDAIRLGDLPEAKFHLAKLILREETFHRIEKAHDYLLVATESGVPGAAGLLGLCYATGHAVQPDLNRAYKLFQQAWQESEEAGAPDYDALNNLAVCLANGTGVPNADIQRALRHMGKAAEGGCKGALRNLERLPRRIFLDAKCDFRIAHCKHLSKKICELYD